MSEREIFDTVETLVRMEVDLTGAAKAELRGGVLLNPRQRLERIIHKPANIDKGFSTCGGNSPYLAFEKGRQVTKQLKNFSVASLRDMNPGRVAADIEIFQMGVAGTTAECLPVFHDSETTDMWSIVLKDLTKEFTDEGLFMEPATPLFNIASDGMVLMCSGDQPTVAELELFYDIVGAFEEAAQK